MKEVELLSTGVYLPGNPVPFDEIEEVIGHLDGAPERIQKLVKKLKPTIKELLGIEQCYFAVDHKTKQITESNASMATKAIQTALKKASLSSNDIDCILLANPLPDYETPPSTTFIQQNLGIEKCAEMEIHSNCTGISKVFQIAFDALRCGRYKKVAVSYSQLSSAYLLSNIYNQEKVGKENLLLRWFLSDSASAAILSARDEIKNGIKIIDVYNESIGGNLEPAMWSYLGAVNIYLPIVFNEGIHHLGQNYSAVNNLAPQIMSQGLGEMLRRFDIKASEIKHVLSTVPSIMLFNSIREEVLKKVGIPTEIWFSNFQKKGYSGGSSVIIGIDEMLEQNIFKPGELLTCATIESSKWMVGGFVLNYLKN